MPKKLTNLRIDEVSSVDRGAGEGVKIMLMKRNKPMSKMSQMFSKVFGGGDSNNVIIDKSLEGLAQSVTSILSDNNLDTEGTIAALSKTFDQCGDHLKNTLAAGPAVIEKKEPEMDLKALAKALGLAETATETEINAAVTKNIATTTALAASVKKMEKELIISKADFTPAELDFWKASQYDDEQSDEMGDGDPKGKGKAKKKFLEAGHAERSQLMKSAEPPVPAHIQKIMDDNEKMSKRLAELEVGGRQAAFAKRAAELNMPETEAVTLQKAYAGDPVAIEKLEAHMKSLVATAKAGGVFKEFGSSSGTGVVTTAYDELAAKAKELQKSDPKMSFPVAFAKVYEDPANAEIAKRERGENRPAAA